VRRNIAVIYHFFAHYRAPVFRELVRDGRHEWTFFADSVCFDDQIKPAEFPPHMRFVRTPVHRIYRSVMWQSGVVRLAISSEFDTLIFLGVPKYLATWVAAIIGRLRGKRVLFWTHGWTYRPKGPLRFVRRYFMRLANALMTYGHWAKQLSREEGFDSSRVHVIGNSLDFDAQSRVYGTITDDGRRAARERLFGRSDVPVVACVSRLIQIRRLDQLLEAMAILRDRGIRAHVLLIGDGPAKGDLGKQAEALGLPVTFTGAMYDEARIGELLAACNACVAPGKVGLTAMHAMAFGVPVISHGDPERQMPEFESIVPGVTGSLFREGDVNDLAAAIEPWIRSPWLDVATHEACRGIVSRFWSPSFQVRAITRAVEGKAADDLFFMRES
jgi:glycosyltransferase involved in cell wall biosynthesis